MRGARLRAPKQWELIDVDEPQPVPGQMLVRMERVAICGSDLPEYLGVHSGYPKDTGGTGHEGIGIVESCPSGSYAEGERVLLWGFDRGLFQEKVNTRDQGLLRLPVDHEPDVVLLTQLLGTVIRPFRKLGNLIHQHTVVLGQGPTGLLFNAVLRNLGACTIIASEPLEYRRQLSLTLGATHVVDPQITDLVPVVKEITDGAMADVVVEAVGDVDTYRLCPDLVRRKGTVIGFGVPDKVNQQGEVKLPLLRMQRREVDLLMTVNAGDHPIEDYRSALDWILQDRIDIRSLLTHSLPFEEIQRGFELAAERPAEGKPVKVILRF
ncbi:MAG: zinc-binding dehydrogenase [Candidatus Latescibacterota bacterium]|nr:zinc-binding dehydrogenase [Candidatus Latescibacterota bacterium]